MTLPASLSSRQPVASPHPTKSGTAPRHPNSVHHRPRARRWSWDQSPPTQQATCAEPHPPRLGRLSDASSAGGWPLVRFHGADRPGQLSEEMTVCRARWSTPSVSMPSTAEGASRQSVVPASSSGVAKHEPAALWSARAGEAITLLQQPQLGQHRRPPRISDTDHSEEDGIGRRGCRSRSSKFSLDGEVFVHESYAHGTFSGSRRDALGRVASHITDGEHAGKRGLEWQA